MVFFSKNNSNPFETLYNDYASYIYIVAYSILKDDHLAQDAVQETFIRIFNNLEKINNMDRNKQRALFVIIVRNISIDIYRQKKKEYSIYLDQINANLSDPGSDIEDIVISNETFKMAAEKIRELNPTYADILSLRYYYNYDNSEISNILCITPQNVRTRLSRAKKCLIELLSLEKEANKYG